MFRFSCFHSPTNSQKPKKTVHLPTELMQKTLEDYNTNKPNKNNPAFSKIPEINNTNNPSLSSMGQDWKSEGLKSMNESDSEKCHEIRKMRKSVSLGSGLAAYQDMTSGDESDGYQKPQASISPQISSNMVNQNASDLSPDYLQQSEKEICDNSETQFSGPHTGRSSPHPIVKSNSLPYLHSGQPDMVHQSQSDSRSNDQTVVNDDVRECDTSPEREIENENENKSDEFEYVGSAKDWVVPTVNELDKGKSVQEDFSDYQWEQLPNEAFKIKRIEKWVMDLQHSSSLEEANTFTDLDQNGENDVTNTILDPNTASKTDANKGILGMDAAKRYISSLNASATSAQLANHGLVVIPFLSAFSSLRALNLSGNSIVRITAGALPRGLHILNLSKNSISTIEGLRELTRLRVLDLSYNRILRIGHGLASCCSLKELYLAGNKISEVEGLHRLLKLNVLDLRFNKLSTTKNLGQLAANYNSLQAISLEGNPAQKNIGDEQLKKFLLGLLPHLAYFNRQSIKTGAMKDSADRAARLGISAHQSDRGLRADSKKSTHGRKSQAVGGGGGGRGRHVRLPPSGVKVTGDRNQFTDVSSKLVSFRPDLAMRRTHSEGLLKAV